MLRFQHNLVISWPPLFHFLFFPIPFVANPFFLSLFFRSPPYYHSFLRTSRSRHCTASILHAIPCSFSFIFCLSPPPILLQTPSLLLFYIQFHLFISPQLRTSFAVRTAISSPPLCAFAAYSGPRLLYSANLFFTIVLISRSLSSHLLTSAFLSDRFFSPLITFYKPSQLLSNCSQSEALCCESTIRVESTTAKEIS